MKPVLAVDICNTIADVNSEILRVLGLSERPPTYGLAEIGITDEEAFFYSHPEVFAGARPIPWSRHVLKHLTQRWTIVYLTARPLWARDITVTWLRRWGYPSAPVFFARRKSTAARALGVLAAIEDAPDAIRDLSAVC